jgi:hypothetical protein
MLSWLQVRIHGGPSKRSAVSVYVTRTWSAARIARRHAGMLGSAGVGFADKITSLLHDPFNFPAESSRGFSTRV